jgi:hypothetical protein
MNCMNPELPRRYKARYGASMAIAIHKNVTLQPGEEFLYSQSVRERKNLFIAQPRFLALTSSRLFLLEHHLFSADWILELPRSAVTHVFRDSGVMKNWINLITPMLETLTPFEFSPCAGVYPKRKISSCSPSSTHFTAVN